MLSRVRLLKPRLASPAMRGHTRHCADDALKTALARAAAQLQSADPGARVLPDGGDLDGATLTGGPKLLLRFTCTNDDGNPYPADAPERTTTKVVSKSSYESGVVLVKCNCCQRHHLIADNMGWFGERGDNIETILAERGEEVQRLRAEDQFDIA